ncbi:hypothetical protein C6P44_000040 [Monosporozyma unispora]|nr:hypothetical protein C6P44_000040 [Kazachstania unispora]
MGLDSDNIKKRLSQLELDVKQMNQMIDDNLHIDDAEDTLRDSNQEEHERGEDEHEHGSDHDSKEADESREYHETEEHNQSYLQDEILEAIENTQQSFVQNAATGDNDNEQANNVHNDNVEESKKFEEPVHHEETDIRHEKHKESQDIAKPESEIIQQHNENNVDEPVENVRDEIATEELQPISEKNGDASPINNEEKHENVTLKSHEQEDSIPKTETEVPKSKQEASITATDDENSHPEELSVETSNKTVIEETVETKNTESIEDQTPLEQPQNHETSEISVPVKEDTAIATEAHPEEIDVPVENDNEDEWEEVSEQEEEEEPAVVNPPVSENNAMRQESTVKYDLAAGGDKIVLPKHNTSTMTPASNIVASSITVNSPTGSQPGSKLNLSTPVERRKSTNPFRVISVGSPNSANGSRINSASSNRSVMSNSSNNNNSGATPQDSESNSKLGDSIATLQSRQEYLINKCNKLAKEIKYLRQMESEGSLTLGDGKKLNRAINKLQEYLDRKTKERYEVGVLLSRQLRRQINRGENGEFWIGRK